MSRTSRSSWLGRFFNLDSAQRPRTQHQPRCQRPEDTYELRHGDTTDRVMAHTRSEARSLFKLRLGLPATGRLPVGAVVTKLPRTEHADTPAAATPTAS